MYTMCKLLLSFSPDVTERMLWTRLSLKMVMLVFALKFINGVECCKAFAARKLLPLVEAPSPAQISIPISTAAAITPPTLALRSCSVLGPQRLPQEPCKAGTRTGRDDAGHLPEPPLHRRAVRPQGRLEVREAPAREPQGGAPAGAPTGFFVRSIANGELRNDGDVAVRQNFVGNVAFAVRAIVLPGCDGVPVAALAGGEGQLGGPPRRPRRRPPRAPRHGPAPLPHLRHKLVPELNESGERSRRGVLPAVKLDGQVELHGLIMSAPGAAWSLDGAVVGSANGLAVANAPGGLPPSPLGSHGRLVVCALVASSAGERSDKTHGVDARTLDGDNEVAPCVPKAVRVFFLFLDRGGGRRRNIRSARDAVFLRERNRRRLRRHRCRRHDGREEGTGESVGRHSRGRVAA
mmetsp:Transcript_5573/g.11598  ORF Transcript_5573/g.11598 Transcript_5573/m.11598 type:complete len:406 (-) Transcript_5573:651-1868(-)